MKERTRKSLAFVVTERLKCRNSFLREITAMTNYG